MTNNVRSPLINRWTDNILNRDKGTGLTAYAVGKIFSGASIARNTDLDTVTSVGIWRILHPTVTQNNIPSISDITGFLQVMDINRDEETDGVYKNIRRIRQIIYPDKADESSPYTRVGESATVNGPITWSDWAMMGGGSLRRVVTSVDVPKALNNVMYEVFTDGLTITLPDAKNVPIGTKIGVEQYVGSGKVVCGGQEQITECDIKVYEPSEVISPVMVSRWTAKPKSETPLYCRSITIQGTDPIDDPTGLSISGSEIENSDGTTFVSIDGQYVLSGAGVGQSRIWKHKTENIYGIYDTQSMTWKFVISSNNLTTIDDVLYEAEYSFKSADALVYVFECALAQDGVTKEWLLDVDNNFAKAVGVLGDRIANVESDINRINDLEPYLHLIRTRTTRHITNPSASQLVCNIPVSDSIEDKVAKLKENNNNVYFYDFVVSVTSSRTINLPTTNVPLGAVVCIEVIGNITVNVVSGEYTGEYVGTAGEILVCEFEYTKVSSSTAAWTILSLGGGASEPDVDPDDPTPDEPDPIVPILTVVTPVNVTGLTEGEVMGPVQLQASIENGVASDIVFSSSGSVAGLSLSSSGVISGTPLINGNVTMNVTVSYPGIASKTIVVNFTIAKRAPIITVTPMSPVTAKVGTAISDIQVGYFVTNAEDGVEATLTASGLPDGLTMSSSGLISGTPTTTGSFSAIITIEYPGADTRTTTVEFTVQPRYASLHEIQQMLDDNDVSGLTARVGEVFTISMLNPDNVKQDYRVILTSINTDTATDTPTANTARFEFLDIVDKRIYDSEIHTYSDSEIRAYLTGSFMDRIPEDIKQIIVSANIECATAFDDSSMITLTDRMFLPSSYELTGMTNHDWYNEGIKSLYYPNNVNSDTTRIRYNDAGESVRWWTRSLCTDVDLANEFELDITEHANVVYPDGSPHFHAQVQLPQGIAPAFIFAGGSRQSVILEAQQSFNTFKSLLRAGDTDALTGWLGVPISIPLDDHDGVSRNYRVMMTSVDTDDTPGYEHSARFEFLDLVDERMYDAYTDNIYQIADIRAYLTSEDADGFMVRLPTWLKNMLVPVNIECVTSYNNSTTEIISDKVFLPSAYELTGGIRPDAWFQEGTKSTYYPATFASDDKRIRYNLSGIARTWWTRTPHRSYSDGVNCVSSGGGVDTRNNSSYNNVYQTRGVAPAFVIAV